MCRPSPCSLLLAALIAGGAGEQREPGELKPPPIAIGLDAYREFRHMYRPKPGVRTFLRSTYDRAGGNEAADASHFLRAEAPDFNGVLDVAGPGILYFARANHWHRRPWNYVVDGRSTIVSERASHVLACACERG